MSAAAVTNLSLSGPFRALVRVKTRSCRTTTVQLALSHRGTPHWRSAVTFEIRQTRCQSTRNAHEPPPPKPSATAAILRMFGGSFRNLLGTFRSQRLKAAFRQNPEELVLALVMCVTVPIIMNMSEVLISFKSRRLCWPRRLFCPTIL